MSMNRTEVMNQIGGKMSGRRIQVQIESWEFVDRKWAAKSHTQRPDKYKNKNRQSIRRFPPESVEIEITKKICEKSQVETKLQEIAEWVIKGMRGKVSAYVDGCMFSCVEAIRYFQEEYLKSTI